MSENITASMLPGFCMAFVAFLQVRMFHVDWKDFVTETALKTVDSLIGSLTTKLRS